MSSILVVTGGGRNLFRVEVISFIVVDAKAYVTFMSEAERWVLVVAVGGGDVLFWVGGFPVVVEVAERMASIPQEVSILSHGIASLYWSPDLRERDR
ncbi:copper homeostasis protein CutC [Sesbania bispinosa]|nr:copper homeostasis protein CutC [Sesbania bispinosa]